MCSRQSRRLPICYLGGRSHDVATQSLHELVSCCGLWPHACMLPTSGQIVLPQLEGPWIACLPACIGLLSRHEAAQAPAGTQRMIAGQTSPTWTASSSLPVRCRATAFSTLTRWLPGNLDSVLLHSLSACCMMQHHFSHRACTATGKHPMIAAEHLACRSPNIRQECAWHHLRTNTIRLQSTPATLLFLASRAS